LPMLTGRISSLFISRMTPSPGLGAVAVEGNGLAQEGLSHEVRHYPAVVFPHFGSVSIEDAHDPCVDPVVAMIGHCQGFGVTLGFVIDAPHARGAYFAPVFFVLRVHERVAVDLRCGGQHRAAPPGAGQSEGVVGSLGAGY
jgi:hypothetical protein